MATPDTVRKLINSALVLSGAVNKGADPDPDEYEDALELFNDMLGGWSTESLILPYIASAQYQTVAGQADYSLGPNGDWNGFRPDKIKYAWYEWGGVTYPMTQLEYEQYGDIAVKSVSSTNPQGFMYNASYPLAYIVLYPVPSAIIPITLAYDATLDNVALDTDLSGMPKGYRLALRYNLAAMIPAMFGKSPLKEISAIAVSSKGLLKSRNLKALDAVFDDALPGIDTGRAWNWRTGEYDS